MESICDHRPHIRRWMVIPEISSFSHQLLYNIHNIRIIIRMRTRMPQGCRPIRVSRIHPNFLAFQK